ncbi:MAG: NAD(P)-binding domain-containing protein, partial [Desulfobacterales bacterium]
MLKNKKISIIGTGNMGEALLSGLISSESSYPKNIICTDIRENRLTSIQKKYGVATTADNIKAIETSEIIIYAVKPQIIASVLKETASCLDMSKLVISIAAGVPLAAIESCLNKKLRLIRVMPNIAAFVKESASVVAAGGEATEEDIKLSLDIFNSMGKSIFLKENILMDAITGLSGSG